MGNKKNAKRNCVRQKRNSKLQQGFRLQEIMNWENVSDTELIQREYCTNELGNKEEPPSNAPFFCKLHDKICDEWEEVAAQVMEEAAAKERKAALDEGRTKNGIAVIDVYVDACWSMRSYGNNYKASSGAAAIIAISHGIKNEEIALEQLAVQERVNIEPCGIFIDEELPFIGASPDGLIGSDTCVEIKCPVVAYKMDWAGRRAGAVCGELLQSHALKGSRSEPRFYGIIAKLHGLMFRFACFSCSTKRELLALFPRLQRQGVSSLARMLLNLAARSSRFTRGRAEVSVDRGLWGAARPRLSRFKTDSPFPCPKTDCPYPRARRPRIITSPGRGRIVFPSIVFVKTNVAYSLFF
ncbi:hypothetical protein EVAR_15031_1 [Eumeta japonica]|uniref:Mutator-like transposase domain-containing protein n=1 Tax=Eumeta variegata TaxID=151549 RepID=A0A4C1X5J9_EUMVA|nr:hypothetical protein EVAR_15031_1 [Eumeta japonica]